MEDLEKGYKTIIKLNENPYCFLEFMELTRKKIQLIIAESSWLNLEDELKHSDYIINRFNKKNGYLSFTIVKDNLEAKFLSISYSFNRVVLPAKTFDKIVDIGITQLIQLINDAKKGSNEMTKQLTNIRGLQKVFMLSLFSLVNSERIIMRMSWINISL